MILKRYDRNEMIKELKENVAEVTFYKVDGELRVMRCTLMTKFLPKVYNEQHMDEMHQKEENLETVVCWDIQKGGWRSFRIDSVEYFESLHNY